MSPTEFSVRRLGMVPYVWQAEAMESVAMGQFTSIVAANGSGKTDRVVAALVLWFLAEFPAGKVVFTSGSFRQLSNQLWPAIRKHRKRFPKWNFLSEEIRTDEGGFAIGFSTDDPGRAEGWHGDPGAPLLLIVDEAKSVPDSIFEAFDRCTRLYQLWVSSPGAPRGQFFDSHHSRAAHFWTRKVRSDECPHIDPDKRARDLQTYGEDHPWYRSAHLAEFTSDTDRMVIDPQSLTKALEGQPLECTDGEVVAFCDFAAGRDENVLAIRRGNVARIKRAWVEKDTMQAAREFVHLCKSEGLQASQVWGDADGLGTAMIDAMAEIDFRINRFHGGIPSSEPDEYANLIGEVWHVGAREIKRGRVNIGTLDPVTFRQLTTRKSEWSDNGKLRVESKEKMAKEGIKSPDRGDALLGCIACGSRITGAVRAGDLVSSETAGNGFGTGHVSGF